MGAMFRLGAGKQTASKAPGAQKAGGRMEISLGLGHLLGWRGHQSSSSSHFLPVAALLILGSEQKLMGVAGGGSRFILLPPSGQ